MTKAEAKVIKALTRWIKRGRGLLYKGAIASNGEILNVVTNASAAKEIEKTFGALSRSRRKGRK